VVFNLTALYFGILDLQVKVMLILMMKELITQKLWYRKVMAPHCILQGNVNTW